MGLTKTEKQGWERYFVYGDFSDVLDDDELIDIGDCVFLAEDVQGDDALADVLDTAAAYVEGSSVYVRVMDGAEVDSPYKFTIRVETSKGNRWEVDGQLKIKEK